MANVSKILVAQGGGPTAVINQSLVGVVLEARKFHQIEKIYGAFHGVRGIVEEDFVDLTQETAINLEMVAQTPAAALGSTRDKPDAKYCQEIFRVLQAHGIGHFFYIGSQAGNGIEGYTYDSSNGTPTLMTGSPFTTGTAPGKMVLSE